MRDKPFGDQTHPGGYLLRESYETDDEYTCSVCGPIYRCTCGSARNLAIVFLGCLAFWGLIWWGLH